MRANKAKETTFNMRLAMQGTQGPAKQAVQPSLLIPASDGLSVHLPSAQLEMDHCMLGLVVFLGYTLPRGKDVCSQLHFMYLR